MSVPKWRRNPPQINPVAKYRVIEISAMLMEKLECQSASSAETSHRYETDKANADSTLLSVVIH